MSETEHHSESLIDLFNRSGEDVFSFLEQHPAARIEDCYVILFHDLRRRFKTDGGFRVESYLERFDFLNEQIPMKLGLIKAEFLARIDCGETPELDEYLNRFPDLAEQLENLLAATVDGLATEHGLDAAFEPTFLGTIPPELDTVASELGSTVDVLPSSRSGERFGDYEIEGEVARGAMGVVYKARQVSLDRQVALKMILASQLAGPEDIRRFRTEAESVAKLDHPGIVPIYEVGELDGQHFFSMGLLEGGSLIRVMRKKSCDPVKAARLILSIAEAIQFAHSKGIIHRDLKPGNVLLDLQGNPKVTDFGLAKRIDTESSLTLTGQIVGTPAYMSPEQAKGDISAIGPASDQYSLGVMLYELCTGARPFEGPIHSLLSQVINDDPPSVRGLNPKTPRDLEAICLRAMQKSPRHRYPSVGEFADDLRRFLNNEPVLTRKYGVRERAARFARRHRTLLLSTASIVLAAFLTWYFIPEPPQPEPSRPMPKLMTVDNVVDRGQAAVSALLNLSSLGRALNNYHDVYQKLPGAVIRDGSGKPLLSWRVAILPYIDQTALYKKFHLDEPWDSPHNLQLLEFMPPDFSNPRLDPKGITETHYRAITGPGTCFETDPSKTVTLREITDSHSTTIVIVEAKEAVPWTKPDEIDVSSGDVVAQLGGVFEEGFHAANISGGAIFFRKVIYDDPEALKSLFGRNDGLIVNLSNYEGFPRAENVIEDDARAKQLKEEQLALSERSKQLSELSSAMTESQNNLRQLQFAMRNYERDFRMLPRQATIDSNGNPLLSWRVTLLPYLGEKALYEKFHLDEPWDSPHNFSLLPLMPDVFRLKFKQPGDPQTTYYQVLTGDDSPFPPPAELPVKFSDIEKGDGLSKTFLIVEAGVAVPWTKPQDVAVRSEEPVAALGGLFELGFHAAMCDGSVAGFVSSVRENQEVLHALSEYRDRILIPPEIFRITPREVLDQERNGQMPLTGGIRAVFMTVHRTRSRNNLKGLQVALREYHDAHNRFPRQAIHSPDGKPLLSWRIELLPYLDEKLLYEKFHLDEPWDSEHNLALLKYMPNIFLSPVPGTNDRDSETYYQVIAGEGTAFPLDSHVVTNMASIWDGTSNTLLLVEAGVSVPWTKPEDVTLVKGAPLPELGGMFLEGFHASTASGTVSLFLHERVNSLSNPEWLFLISDKHRIDLQKLIR